MKEVMCKAWKIARNAAKKFGGKAIEYIGGALKMAWEMAKKLTEKQIEILESKGFNRWTKYGKDRLYFDLEKAGLMKVSRYKTGNISSAYYKGEKIANSQASRLLSVKVWLDLNENGRCYTSSNSENSEIVANEAKKICQEVAGF